MSASIPLTIIICNLQLANPKISLSLASRHITSTKRRFCSSIIYQKEMTDKVADGDGGGDWSMTDGIDVDGGGSGPTVRRTDEQSLREMQLSIAASASVFPGFRFSPTDDELISYYLKKKLQGSDQCVDIIPEVDFCRHEPWDLPALSIIRSDNEWFFFSTRGKKYPNGSQSKRATQSGYWKATGKERNVKSGAVTIGTKRTLVFHIGRAPKGERTEWIMHEYCMNDSAQESLVVCRLRRNGDFRLTESSRGSSDHRSLSATENCHSTTNEYADNAPTDGFLDGFHDEPNVVKSTSKDSTSSYMSHSVEQNDSGSEANHEWPDGSSSLNKDFDECFADIINDDIIQLDESASQSLKVHGVTTTCSQEVPLSLPQQTMSAQPFSVSGQGTAFRRLKLRRQKVRTHEPQPAQDGQDHHHNQKPLEKKSSGCLVSLMSGKANTLSGSRTTHVVLVFFFLVIVFTGLEFYESKGNMGICGLGVWKRQVKHWLGKVADYI